MEQNQTTDPIKLERVTERVIPNEWASLANQVASLQGYSLNEEKVISQAEARENSLNEYFRTLEDQEMVIDLADLMNPEFRNNLPFVTSSVLESIASIMNVELSLKQFEIEPKSNTAADICLYRLTNKVLQGMIENLFVDLNNMIEKEDLSATIFDMLYEALRDILERGPLNFTAFCVNNGLDPDEEYSTIKFNEKLEEETMNLLNRMFQDPVNGNFLAAPKGYEEIKSTLKSILPESEHSYIDDFTPESIYTPTTQQYVIENWKDLVDTDKFNEIVKLFNDYVTSNAAEITEAQYDDNGNMVQPPMCNFNSLSLSTVFLHALSRASEELYNPELTNEDFSDVTEYVLDGIARVLYAELDDKIAEIGLFTPYKILSCFFSRYNTVFTGSIVAHMKDTQMVQTINKIATIFNDYTLKVLHDSPEEVAKREQLLKEMEEN